MKKKLTITLALAAMLSSGQSAPPAGTPPGRGGQPPDPQTMVAMKVAMLTAQLSLTDSQKAIATQIYTDGVTAAQALRSDMDTNRQSLSPAIKANDVGMIDALAAAGGVLSGRLTAINAKADAAFYAILTTDQQTKYSAGGPGRGGPAGFGRMPPPF